MIREDAVERALASERVLFTGTRLLDAHEAVGRAKALLVRSTARPLPAAGRVRLDPLTCDADWQEYQRARVLVEAGFGIHETTARVMVSALRERVERSDLSLHLARDGDRVVGAIGWFHLPGPAQSWARLQEVDVFPPWRGRGHGDALLAATGDALVAEAVTTVVVGADEDDWPLGWYRRRGFQDVARVPASRPTGADGRAREWAGEGPDPG